MKYQRGFTFFITTTRWMVVTTASFYIISRICRLVLYIRTVQLCVCIERDHQYSYLLDFGVVSIQSRLYWQQEGQIVPAVEHESWQAESSLRTYFSLSVWTYLCCRHGSLFTMCLYTLLAPSFIVRILSLRCLVFPVSLKEGEALSHGVRS